MRLISNGWGGARRFEQRPLELGLAAVSAERVRAHRWARVQRRDGDVRLSGAPDQLGGGILFDDAVRDAILLGSRDSRNTAAVVSDDIYYALAAYPLLVDTAIVTWGIHGASDVAFQMMLINFESYALTGALALTAEKLGRVRPMGRECANDPNYDGKCGNQGNLNASFLSGHTTIAFAGAGLMCAHHTHLPLYGGRVADILACATGLAAATTAGVLRVMSDNHYASDVLLGSGVGLFGGYVWPMLWHYGFGSKGTGFASFLPHIHARHGGSLCRVRSCRRLDQRPSASPSPSTCRPQRRVLLNPTPTNDVPAPGRRHGGGGALFRTCSGGAGAKPPKGDELEHPNGDSRSDSLRMRAKCDVDVVVAVAAAARGQPEITVGGAVRGVEGERRGGGRAVLPAREHVSSGGEGACVVVHLQT